uniref:Exocyst complex component Sec8 n=1 Tax=Aegilops tauschii subsp. strangulata TaxID=200361 RepID=A0A453P0J1_AEGTS
EAMVEASNDTGANNGLKHIENMVLFQYLVHTLEADFVPRHIAYKGKSTCELNCFTFLCTREDILKHSCDFVAESLDWVIIRESVLNVLLGSRKLVFKTFVKNCISLLNQHQREVEDDISSKSASDLDSSLTISSLEFEREALISVKKLFIMVINLDLIRQEADKLGLTSRADGLRNPILEVILEELTYNTIYLS